MKIDWNVADIQRQISRMHSAATDPYLTGWNQWPVKQDLYRLKWQIDRALENCSTFADEEKFLNDHEKEVLIEVLKS